MRNLRFLRLHLDILLGVFLTAWAPAAQVLDVGSSKQLFLDDRMVEKLEAARRVWNQPVKYEDNPIMRGEQPWENWVVYPDGGPVVLFDAEEGGFNVIHNLDTQATLGSLARGRRREGAIGLARLRLDGFASLDAAFQTATVTTRILRFTGSRLLLNIQLSMKGRGAVDELSRFQVEITTPEGTPLPGYSFQESDDLAQGGIRIPAKWEGSEDVSSLSGQRVRLRFRYRNAKFYSFQFEPARLGINQTTDER